MKEIVNRLQENRQIELARAILESEGYTVSKMTFKESVDIDSDDELDLALDYQYGTDRDKDNSKYTDMEKKKALAYWYTCSPKHRMHNDYKKNRDNYHKFLSKNYSIKESAENTDIADLKGKIHIAVEHYMMSEGYEEDEIDEYTAIDFEESVDNVRIEVRAELSYEGLMNLADELNPIIQAIDAESYFEPVDSGIIEAYVIM